ncbi:Ionotropic receptor 634 [Blattella germanica]|nr:Ionotropic receptor 634 [Blattella germanica]
MYLYNFKLSFCTVLFFLTHAQERLTTFQNNIVSCMQDIMKHYFVNSYSVTIAFPNLCQVPNPRSLQFQSPKLDHQVIVEKFLLYISNESPIHILNSDDNIRDLQQFDVLQEVYFLFLYECQGFEDHFGDINHIQYEDLEEVLEFQINNILNKPWFNPRGKYILIIPECPLDECRVLSYRLTQKWWIMSKMVHFIFVVPHINEAYSEYATHDLSYEGYKGLSISKTFDAPLTSEDSIHKSADLDILAWFPYYNNNCGEVDEMVLLNQWFSVNGGQFSKGLNLFRYKVPAKFSGCPFITIVVGSVPYAIITKNYTNENGEPVLEMEGLGPFLVNSFTKRHNFSVQFLPYRELRDVNIILRTIEIFSNGKVNLITGAFPLYAFFVPFGEYTVPIINDAVVFICPCPRPIGRLRSVLNMFTMSTWLAVVIVLVSSSLILYLHTKRDKNEVKHYKNFGNCSSSSWAILLGVSAPHLPESANNRCYFAAYVWYSLAINVVFQTFFVSFLVEPRYEQKFRTLEDLRNNDVKYGYHEFGEFLLGFVEYRKQEMLEWIECEEPYGCIRAVITHQNMSSLSSAYIPFYISKEMGLNDVSRFICFIEETVMTGYVSMGVRKGCPLLSLLDDHLTRSISAGLHQQYWSDLKHRVNLKAERTEEEEMYFVFSMSHLAPIFGLLGSGFIISILSFTVEILVYALLVKRIKQSKTNNVFKL